MGLAGVLHIYSYRTFQKRVVSFISGYPPAVPTGRVVNYLRYSAYTTGIVIIPPAFFIHVKPYSVC